MTKAKDISFEQIEKFLQGNIVKLKFKAVGEAAYMVGPYTYPKSKLIDQFAGRVAQAIDAGEF